VSVWSGRLRQFAGGPVRRLAIGTAIGLMAFIGVTLWRMQSLDGLPDVGDPFDVAEARRPIEIADADNAFIAYAEVHRLLDKRPNRQVDYDRYNSIAEAVQEIRIESLTWSSASPTSREYLKAQRAALETWREGSERRDALYYQPGEISVDSVIPLIPDAAVFAGLAALEGSRLEEAGARDAAWRWYRAMLRSSRLIGRHGVLVQRMFGAQVHALASRCILRWAADPHVGAGQIRRALDDVLAADVLTPPLSESIKIDYLSILKPLANRDSFEWMMLSLNRMPPLMGGRQFGLLDQVLPGTMKVPLQRFQLRATNEQERARRLFRLIYANWLAQVDRPAGRRAPLAIRAPIGIYADDPSAPAAARAVPPESLVQALQRSAIDFLSGRDKEPYSLPWEGRGELVREGRRRSVLIVRLAAELYRREHGAAPATAGALLGKDLKELPEGIAADDPIPAGLE
jgi:hypothetical protein